MADRPWESIAPAGDREYFALASFLPLKRYRKIPAFLRLAEQVVTQLRTSGGLIGFSFRVKFLSRTVSTLSVWEDERAPMDFVPGNPHVGTKQAVGPHMGPTRFSSCSGRAPESRPHRASPLAASTRGAPPG